MPGDRALLLSTTHCRLGSQDENGDMEGKRKKAEDWAEQHEAAPILATSAPRCFSNSNLDVHSFTLASDGRVEGVGGTLEGDPGPTTC